MKRATNDQYEAIRKARREGYDEGFEHGRYEAFAEQPFGELREAIRSAGGDPLEGVELRFDAAHDCWEIDGKLVRGGR